MHLPIAHSLAHLILIVSSLPLQYARLSSAACVYDSDGVLNPTELITLVATRGVKVASLTDHDTMAGVAEAVAVGNRLGVRVIPGVEISAAAADATDVIHILGYFPTALVKQQTKIQTPAQQPPAKTAENHCVMSAASTGGGFDTVAAQYQLHTTYPPQLRALEVTLQTIRKGR
jgi:predicted metal-dependent phosphoesterase TrpH